MNEKEEQQKKKRVLKILYLVQPAGVFNSLFEHGWYGGGRSVLCACYAVRRALHIGQVVKSAIGF